MQWQAPQAEKAVLSQHEAAEAVWSLQKSPGPAKFMLGRQSTTWTRGVSSWSSKRLRGFRGGTGNLSSCCRACRPQPALHGACSYRYVTLLSWTLQQPFLKVDPHSAMQNYGSRELYTEWLRLRAAVYCLV